MNRFSEQIRTDMASEQYSARAAAYAKEHAGAPDGIVFSRGERCGIGTETVEITNEAGAALFGKPVGIYETLHTKDLLYSTEEETARVVTALADGITAILRRLSKKREIPASILLIGLGNDHITADAIGTAAAYRVAVTRHLFAADPPIFEKEDEIRPVSVITPGVVGQTGIETLALCRGAVEEARPEAVILVDALAARSTATLGRTVQLCSCGIRPGSGIGNRRLPLDRETLGVPTMTVGVPTVIDTATLLCDAAETAESAAGPFSEEQQTALLRAVDACANLYVAPKDVDAIVGTYSRVIARAVNRVFLGREDFPGAGG